MKIRQGIKTDVPSLLKLIKELAEFEKAPDEVQVTEESMIEDGFGKKPLYEFIVAENEENIIVAAAVYYWRYSTWKGKRLYLEDLIVTEKFRNQGIGKMLFNKLFKIALDENCSGMMWMVLDWNDQAIHFYNRYSPEHDAEWINCSLSREQIRSFTEKNS